jgi:hypothetical protein
LRVPCKVSASTRRLSSPVGIHSKEVARKDEKLGVRGVPGLRGVGGGGGRGRGRGRASLVSRSVSCRVNFSAPIWTVVLS